MCGRPLMGGTFDRQKELTIVTIDGQLGLCLSWYPGEQSYLDVNLMVIHQKIEIIFLFFARPEASERG